MGVLCDITVLQQFGRIRTVIVKENVMKRAIVIFLNGLSKRIMIKVA